ncbi:AraC-like DNA-binding protein [Flavobacterium nitrogenifigens]|uniref:AraC-like DNA-binding protein n=2 Tax=Flavobacterium TaxID=237 RepID=A0A7W7IXJ0_9FLAO|nr:MULTISPECIES: AraC family transcriptional regulator [Flavobacterium]MBB4802123.1 AraC-like DNA-binding protein [Flavobacterium nitrogenifigens]MBB6387081.1 AraC-like DNA-binding protein [Flavobacterium notoginsengisoli]
MFINVRIKEVDKEFLHINLLDHYTEAPDLNEKKEEIVNYDFLDGRYFVYYTDGFCLLRCNYELAYKCTDIIKINDDYIHISLLASGSYKVLKKGADEHTKLTPGSLSYAYLRDHDVEMEMSAEEEPLHYTRIFLSRKFYLGLLENENWIKKDHFYKQVKAGKYLDFGSFRVPMNYNIVEILNSIVHNAHKGALGHYYLLSKLKELFLISHIFKLEKVVPSGMKATDYTKIEHARIFLEKNYKKNPTIKQVSRTVLLNEFKLKSGFKEVYRQTMHSYITELRMEHARKLLMQESAVNEVSALLGYKNVSHFISSFRKHFGVTPKQLAITDLFTDAGKAVCLAAGLLFNDVLAAVCCI